jgi:hypothetical protein
MLVLPASLYKRKLIMYRPVGWAGIVAPAVQEQDIVAESFNLLNHQNVSLLNTAFGSSALPQAGFNRPTGTSTARRIQFSLDCEFSTTPLNGLHKLCYLSGVLLVKLVVQFIDLRSGLVQSLFACSCDLVDPATVPSNVFEDRLQQTAVFQAMQERVKGSGTDAIPMMCQLLHHRKPKDGLVGGMYEYMNPYEAEKEFPLMVGHKSNIPRYSQNRMSIV